VLRSLYTAATGMDAQQLKMDVISNNLANASTTGFKAARAEFEDLLADTIRGSGAPGTNGGAPTPLQVGLGVQAGSTSRMFGQGTLTTTQNPTDLAIQGSGFFQVQLATGELAYTRAGNFTLDATGRLVTQNGQLVQPGITIPQNASNLTVKSDGTVSVTVGSSTTPTQVGQIQIFNFTNPTGLSDIGNNLYTETGASGTAQQIRATDPGAPTIAQGQLEGSNVSAVEQMVEMIACQHAYELNSKVIQSADQMLGRLTSIK